MSLAPSLKHRIRRLEAAAAIRAEPTLTDLLRKVEERRGAYRAMTPEEREAERAARRADCIAALDEDDAPARTVRAALQEVRRRAGRLHASAERIEALEQRSPR